MIKKTDLNFYLILLSSMLINITYLPNVNLSIDLIMYISTLLLVFVNFECFKQNIIRGRYLWISIIPIFSLVLFYKIIYGDTIIDDPRALIVGIFIIFTFLSIKIGDNKKDFLITIVSMMTLITSYIVILYYYSGNLLSAITHIGDYFWSSKNTFSPILLISTVYFLYRALFDTSKIFGVLYILGFLSIIIIQSRTIILAVLVVSLVMLFKKFISSRYKVVSIFILFGGIFSLVIFFSNKIQEYLSKIFRIDAIKFNGKSSFLDNFTSGRISSSNFAFNLFCDKPLIGTAFREKYMLLDPSSEVGIHSLWLRGLFYGGIIYFLLLAIFLIVFLFYFRKYIKENFMFRILLLIGIIVSMAEPSAPFSPGTTYYYYWLVFGLIVNDSSFLNCKKEYNVIKGEGNDKFL